ncbi:MAG: hypothetical protein KDH94_07490, partial [Coxiellaceae bacterium]|nr:hypothetical protein [Coxiellaceae bacterium]
AKDNRIRFYTIGLGANQMQVDSILGPITVNAPDDLDEKILEKLANESGGMFFRAKSAKDLTRVYEKINQLEPVKIDQTYLQPKTPLYPWLLAAAFVLLLIIRVIQWR